MSIFNSLQSQNALVSQNAMNPMQLVQQIQRNPAAMLRQRGLTIPDGMTNPQQIVQHLLQSGQVPQARYQQIMSMMGHR